MGNYLSDVSLFKHSIENLSEMYASMTLNQIKVITAMPTCEDLQLERRVTSLKNSFSKANCGYSLIRFRQGKLWTPRGNSIHWENSLSEQTASRRQKIGLRVVEGDSSRQVTSPRPLPQGTITQKPSPEYDL